ncbi:MAG: hypothetical protein KatS3mg060_2015 [Dehalococcoidia bacterium]|nr:MAG: hypothetical protein KatS3mg060_2015 [Dehalococcoidia bacterium]
MTFGVLLLATVGSLLFSALALPPDGTWSGDTGIRVLQVMTLRERGSFAVPYLGQPVDPANRWNPLSPRYFSWQADGFYPKFSPAYAVLVAAFDAVLGRRTAAWPAALSLAAGAAALWWVLRAAGSRASWAAAPAIVFLSPLLFYANELWEHEIATALAVTGVAALVVAQLRWSAGQTRTAFTLAVLAGAALGMGLWFRGELYAFVPAVVLAVLFLFWRGWRLVAAALAACLAAAVPLVIAQSLLYGRPEGAQVAVDSPLVLRGAGPTVVVTRMLRQWIDTIPGLVVPQGPTLAWATAAIAVGLGALGAVRGAVWGRWLLVIGCAGAGALALLSLALRLAPVDLVASYPFILAALFALGTPPTGQRGVVYRVFGLSALLSLLFAMLTAPSSGGAQHGPRYLMLAYPLLAGCAILALERWAALPHSRLRTVGLATAALLVVASLAVQVAGLRNLVVIREQYARIARAAALVPGPIVTDLWWYPQVIPAELLRRPVFFVSDPAGFGALADRLAETGSARFTFVSSIELAVPLKPPAATPSGRSLQPDSPVLLPERGLTVVPYQIE